MHHSAERQFRVGKSTLFVGLPLAAAGVCLIGYAGWGGATGRATPILIALSGLLGLFLTGLGVCFALLHLNGRVCVGPNGITRVGMAGKVTYQVPWGEVEAIEQRRLSGFGTMFYEVSARKRLRQLKVDNRYVGYLTFVDVVKEYAPDIPFRVVDY